MMNRNCVVGYCDKLYSALHQVGQLAVPYEPYDGILKRGDIDKFKREQTMEHLMAALIGTISADEDMIEYVGMLYESIDHEQLRMLVEEGFLEELYFTQPGYFVAIEKASPS